MEEALLSEGARAFLSVFMLLVTNDIFSLTIPVMRSALVWDSVKMYTLMLKQNWETLRLFFLLMKSHNEFEVDITA